MEAHPLTGTTFSRQVCVTVRTMHSCADGVPTQTALCACGTSEAGPGPESSGPVWISVSGFGSHRVHSFSAVAPGLRKRAAGLSRPRARSIGSVRTGLAQVNRAQLQGEQRLGRAWEWDSASPAAPTGGQRAKVSVASAALTCFHTCPGAQVAGSRVSSEWSLVLDEQY